MSSDRWLDDYNRLYEGFSDFNPRNIIMYSLGLIKWSQRRDLLIKITRQANQHQCFLKLLLIKFTIIQHPQARFFIGFWKNTNILRYVTYTGETKNPDAYGYKYLNSKILKLLKLFKYLNSVLFASLNAL